MTLSTLSRLLLLANFASVLAAQSSAVEVAGPVKQPKSNSERWRAKVISPLGYLQPTMGSLLRHARNTPHEWERSWVGLGKRVGSSAASHAIKNSIKYGVGSLLHEELHFQPSGKVKFAPRLGYALLSTVITRKRTTGNRTVAFGEIAGVTGSGLISRLWQPLRLRTVSSGFTTAGIILGSDAAFNVVREFWPEIRRLKPGKKKPALAPIALQPAADSDHLPQ